MTVLQAIRTLEPHVIDGEPTTQAHLSESGREEARNYLQFLRNASPYHATSIPHWDDLTRKPSKP